MGKLKMETANMGDTKKSLWLRRNWWLLPIAVLLLLLGAIYILGHMSSADSEMYPTTQVQTTPSCARLC